MVSLMELVNYVNRLSVYRDDLCYRIVRGTLPSLNNKDGVVIKRDGECGMILDLYWNRSDRLHYLPYEELARIIDLLEKQQSEG